MLSMQTSLRALTALAILGTVGFIVAQQVASSGGQGSSSQPSGRGSANGDRATINGQLYQAVRNQHPGPWTFAPPTGAQKVLQRYIPAETNRLIELAEASGKSGRISKIIEVQCYYMLAVMRPDEQKHEIYDVWNVDVWKPGGQWDHVISAPTLVHDLAVMSDTQGQAVRAAFAKRENEWMQPFMDLNHRIAEEVGKDMERFRSRYNEELKKLIGSRTKADLGQAYVAKLEQGMKEAYALLTPVQKREWDLILSNLKSDALAAYNGDSPELGISNK